MLVLGAGFTSSEIPFFGFVTAEGGLRAPLEPPRPLRVEVGDFASSERSSSAASSPSASSADPGVEAFLVLRFVCRFFIPSGEIKVIN